MTILVTQISRHGIVHAADSNLTTKAGLPAGQASKLFPINRLAAALTVAGTYAVGRTIMDTWITNFINNDTSSNLAGFVASLVNSMQQQASQAEKLSGYCLHVAGYVGPPGASHPEFYHATNYSIDPNTGGYSVLNPSLRFTEDFWSQNSSVPKNQLFANGKGYIYCNG